MEWPLINFDNFMQMMKENNMTSSDCIDFSKFCNLSASMYRQNSIKTISEDFCKHRSTISRLFSRCKDVNFILNTKFGRLITIPTWQSFLGKCIFASDDIAILISNLPNTKISCLLTVYDCGTVRELSKGKIYFCELDKVISVETKIKNTHIDILAKGLKQAIDLSSIDEPYIKGLKYGNEEHFHQEVGLL